jgi:hypothetical protein
MGLYLDRHLHFRQLRHAVETKARDVDRKQLATDGDTTCLVFISIFNGSSELTYSFCPCPDDPDGFGCYDVYLHFSILCGEK